MFDNGYCSVIIVMTFPLNKILGSWATGNISLLPFVKCSNIQSLGIAFAEYAHIHAIVAANQSFFINMFLLVGNVAFV